MGNRERRVRYNVGVLGGEGSDEVEFFLYLRSLYLTKLVNLKIRDGHGGSPKKAVETALRNLPQLGAYCDRMMVFDGDRTENLMLGGINECAREPEIEYVISNPRFEVELGRLLECDSEVMAKLQHSDRSIVKQAFNEICPPGERRYARLFPKEVLEEKRKTSEWLDEIISFMERGNSAEDDEE